MMPFNVGSSKRQHNVENEHPVYNVKCKEEKQRRGLSVRDDCNNSPFSVLCSVAKPSAFH